MHLAKLTIAILNAILLTGRPLFRQCEIPWRFMPLRCGTRHVKCYSYHARTSTKYQYGRKYTVYNK